MRCTMRRYRATRFGLWLLVKDIHGIGIDEDEFDQLFKTEVIKKTSLVNGNGVGSGGAGKNSKGSVVNVIYAYRANNVGIIIARIKCDCNDMARF